MKREGEEREEEVAECLSMRCRRAKGTNGGGTACNLATVRSVEKKS